LPILTRDVHRIPGRNRRLRTVAERIPPMKPKTLSVVGTFALAAAAAAGCALNRSETRKESFIPRIGGSGAGKVIEPKRCTLTVTIVSKPLRDKVINDAVWSCADTQSVNMDVQNSLQANGIRMGVIMGSLPAQLETVLHAPPPDQIDPVNFDLPDGSNTLIALGDSMPTASLLLTRDGHASGKDYRDASGWFRVTANQSGPTGVALRLVPEIRHGEVLRRYDALQSSPTTLNSMEFTVKDGQQEETLRDLAATLTLQPGQTAVIGCDPERPGSLGAFLFTRPEPKSDRLIQKLVIVQASRTHTGVPGSQATVPSRLDPVEPPDLPFLPRRGDSRRNDASGANGTASSAN
jgi:hypothetical protein